MQVSLEIEMNFELFVNGLIKVEIENCIGTLIDVDGLSRSTCAIYVHIYTLLCSALFVLQRYFLFVGFSPSHSGTR